MRVDPNYVNNLAVAIDQSSGAEQTLTSELSSGLRVTSLSVDPVASAQSALLGTAIAQADSYVQTASNEQSLLQVTDSTLGEVVSQLTSALSTAVQGSNGTQNAAGLTAVAQQLSGIRDQVLSLANTSYLGSYLFSGSQGSTQPFTLDSSTVPATVNYAGDTSVQSVATPSGQKIPVNLPGSTVFGSGASGVFTALNNLIADFSGGTASASATADIASLTTALGQLSSQRSALDSSLSRLQSTSSYVQTQATQLTAQQSTLVSADPSTVATQLKSAETQHQAILSVVAALGNVDLFSLMK